MPWLRSTRARSAGAAYTKSCEARLASLDHAAHQLIFALLDQRSAARLELTCCSLKAAVRQLRDTLVFGAQCNAARLFLRYPATRTLDLCNRAFNEVEDITDLFDVLSHNIFHGQHLLPNLDTVIQPHSNLITLERFLLERIRSVRIVFPQQLELLVKLCWKHGGWSGEEHGCVIMKPFRLQQLVADLGHCLTDTEADSLFAKADRHWNPCVLRVELTRYGLLPDTIQELPQMPFDALAFCSAAAQYGYFGESSSEPTQCKVHEIRNVFASYPHHAHHMVAEVVTPGGTKFRIDWRHGTRILKNAFLSYESATGLDAYSGRGGFTEECKSWCIQFEQDINREAREFLKEYPFEYLISAVSGRDCFMKEEVCDQDCCYNIFELVTRGKDFAIDDKSIPYFEEFRRRSQRLQQACLD